MPVQAQQLPSLGEHRNRTIPQLDAPGLLISAPFNRVALMDDSQQQQRVFVGVDGMHRIIPHGSSPLLPVQGLMLPNFSHLYQHAPASAAAMECVNVPTVVNAMGGARKKRKESNDIRRHTQPQQAHLQQLGVDLNQTLAASFPHQAGTLVSTGLRLAFDDERSTVTSSRPSSTPACASSLTLGDELAVQCSSHQEDLHQLLKAQAEQLRHALEERMQMQAKALMASVEGEVSRKIREKEVEMERVSRRNSELEERVRQLSMEREVWQSKAKSNEAMVAILRSNLQQAMVQAQHQSRELSRIEGCGDSEADDAASVYIDDNLPAQQSRAMMMRNVMMKSSHVSASSELAAAAPAVVRACRRCGANEASVLVLPCLHLCLCLQCNQTYSAERCPVCNALVSNSAEVFLS